MLRLHIKVGNKYYYDIGLRRDNIKLPKTQWQFGEKCPRYLEDFINKYGKSKIRIIEYGKLLEDKLYIDGLLK